MRDLLLTLLIFGILPFIFSRPHLGVLVWSWLGYMNPHRMTFGFAHSFPFVAIVAGITLISLMFSKEKKSLPINGITITWIIFVLWCVFTYFFAMNPSGAAIELDRMIKIQVMILCTLLLFNSKERLIQLTWVISLSIGFYGIKGGVFALLTGFNYRIWGPRGFISGNNELALALLMIIPLFYFLFTVTTNKHIKRLLLLFMMLCLFSVISSYSRGAFLGLAVMSFFLWLGMKKKVLVASIVVCFIALGYSFIPDKWFDRMNTIENYEDDGSANQRLNSWGFAINLANDNPIMGGGFRTFTHEAYQLYGPIPDMVYDAHSIYFEVLAEQGYVGLVLFLTLWILVFHKAHTIKRALKKKQD
ncbi:MAG: putative O-glycosylation ligase, exosortase A system-associated, partial [Flavobacteriaceae bacterium]|nr:putative O-glycosylation ligase, exosortase A system-associated [Flavobacteriaceae bacterium]